MPFCLIFLKIVKKSWFLWIKRPSNDLHLKDIKDLLYISQMVIYLKRR